jgi:glycosyltransferase involved in cell wall biosynthesis
VKKVTNKISVIICAYTEDRWPDLVEAVESVLAQTLSPEEIILVIDHNPTLFERVQSRFPAVIAVQNSEAPGLSGARNSGIAAARGEVLAFLDDDAVAAPDWLEKLAATYHQPGVIAVGGSIEPSWRADRPGWFPDEFNWVVGCTYRGMPRSTTPVRNLIGANMSFRRRVFEDIGGFRNAMGRIGSFPAGCEETELCIRAHQHWPQKLIVYNPEARALHRIPFGRARPRYFVSRCYAEGTSKALVSRLVGAGDGLSSERTYTFKTLPRGISRGVGDALLRGDPTGLMRAAAIFAGLACTSMGYIMGIFSDRLSRSGGRIRENVVFPKNEYQI